MYGSDGRIANYVDFSGLEQDYEYASYNPVAFDIANHFCEMTADYHSDEPHLLNQESFPGEFVDALRFACLIFDK